MSVLQNTVAHIAPLDAAVIQQTMRRQAQLTKPIGALGRLETLSVQLAGIMGTTRPMLDRRSIVVAVGSHGIADEDVSAYPATVTAQMVHNFLVGGAAINVLASNAAARLVVVDAGVAADLPSHPQLHNAKLAYGTHNFLYKYAMPVAHAVTIIEAGITFTHKLADKGTQIVALGEMGIGNTTSAAAIVAAATGAAVANVTGRGTLIDDVRLARKIEVIERALVNHQPDPNDGIALLHTVGGYEIGFLAGCCLGAAERRLPIVLDGYITAAAALIALRLCPLVQPYLIASHRSVEPGHQIALEHLRLEPLLNLDLRLGEGSGAALALPIIVAAARVLNEMATFEQAGVDDKQK
jgi:nicotinate-nucleotide--dimethylbenzimidazole phosphoribosyltransferase